jgi:hypothetical protein
MGIRTRHFSPGNASPGIERHSRSPIGWLEGFAAVVVERFSFRFVIALIF